MDFTIHHFMYFLYNEIPLHFYSTWNVHIIKALVNFTLHHSWARIVFDIAFPPGLRHLQMLGEPLFSEVLDGIVVSVGHEVLDSHGLCVRLQSIHEPSAIPFNLILSSNSQKYDFSEFLCVKWSENAATYYRRPVADSRNIIFFGDLGPYHHGFVLAIHSKSYYVVPRHSW